MPPTWCQGTRTGLETFLCVTSPPGRPCGCRWTQPESKATALASPLRSRPMSGRWPSTRSPPTWCQGTRTGLKTFLYTTSSRRLHRVRSRAGLTRQIGRDRGAPAPRPYHGERWALFPLDDAMLMEQAKDDIQAVSAQVDFQLVVQGKVGQPQQRAAVHKIDDVDAAEVLFDVKDSAARHAGCIGDQSVVDPAVRHDQYRLPVSLAEQRVEKTDAPLLHLAEALPSQIGLIPTGCRALEEPLHLLKDGGCALAGKQVLTRRDLTQVR